ncbi:MAG: hypothetical protein ABSA83_20225 [Verrucomicrobiota bacterium]|jgi:hypothetical protein
MTSSFAYIQGQEAEALDYYDKRLQSAVNPTEREQLEKLVQDLRSKLEKTNQPLPARSLPGLSLSCAA